MSEHLTPIELDAKAALFGRRIGELKEAVTQLPEATKVDLEPRVERMETMISAFRRDVQEIEKPTGATEETANDLELVIERELMCLKSEVETISIGNPTTVTAALDASIEAFDRIGEAVKKAAHKIGL
ncbi:MAG: hypothetical protein AAF236_15840 [Verrucomicrobiota bacterium]